MQKRQIVCIRIKNLANYLFVWQKFYNFAAEIRKQKKRDDESGSTQQHYYYSTAWKWSEVMRRDVD